MLEGRAARAAIDVSPRDAPGQNPPVQRGEPLADLRARTVPGLPAPHERLAGLEDECLHLLSAHFEHIGDLTMGVVAELKQRQRSPLVGRQPLHVLEHLAQLFPPLDLVRQAIESRPIHCHVVEIESVAARTQFGQAAVSSDRIQPGPQGNLTIAATQGPVGGDKGQLQRVLGRLSASQHVHAEREQAACIPIVDGLEGAAFAGSHLGHQVVVGLIEYRPSLRQGARADEEIRGTHAHSLPYLAARVQPTAR
jgi:hypothetical protein